MSRVKTNANSREFRELEIRAQDDKWFWAGWTVSSAVIFAVSWRELPSFTTISVPFWSLWAIGFAICQLRGWMGIIWSRKGIEVLKVFSDHVEYYTTGGTIFDRKKLSFPLEQAETPKVEVLTLGLGANAAQNRIHVKAVGGGLYLGRSLSAEDAGAVQRIVSEWLRPSSRSQLVI
jgi:hypothetical protein